MSKHYQVFLGLNMFRRKFCSIKKLAKKVGYKRRCHNCENFYLKEVPLLRYDVKESVSTTPRGCLVVYVADERQRFVVPTSCLSHPLFKILLAKAFEEFGYNQKNGLAVPCSVATFQEVLTVMTCSRGMFDVRHLVQEFII